MFEFQSSRKSLSAPVEDSPGEGRTLGTDRIPDVVANAAANNRQKKAPSQRSTKERLSIRRKDASRTHCLAPILKQWNAFCCAAKFWSTSHESMAGLMAGGPRFAVRIDSRCDSSRNPLQLFFCLQRLRLFAGAHSVEPRGPERNSSTRNPSMSLGTPSISFRAAAFALEEVRGGFKYKTCLSTLPHQSNTVFLRGETRVSKSIGYTHSAMADPQWPGAAGTRQHGN